MPKEHLNEAALLVQQLQANLISPKQLTRHQKKLCVRLFMDEFPGSTDLQIGQLLGLDRSTVSRMKKEVIWQDGWRVEQLDAKEYASKLLREYATVISKLQQNAVRLEQAVYVDKAGKEHKMPRSFQAAIVWEKVGFAYKTLTDQLMELGLMKRAPIEFEGRMTLRGLLDRVRELHEKRLINPVGADFKSITADETKDEATLTAGRSAEVSPSTI